MPDKVTAFILTQNNQRTIRRCLDSVSWCDEIVVIDSNSSDNTLQIINEFSQIKLYHHQYTNAREQRIWGMQHVNTEWVFIIDSDEYCSASLKDKLQDMLSTDNLNYDGFLIFTRTLFFGKLLKHQDFISSFGKRLVRTSIAVNYKENVRVHASIILVKKTRLSKKYYLVHDPIDNLSNHFVKMSRYAKWQAEDMYEKNKSFQWWHVFLRPTSKFMKLYFINGGWRDGIRGLIICLLGGWSVFLKFLYLYELKIFKRNE